MCFSPEVSFTASVLLVTAGIATLRNTSSTSQFFLAAIPLLFGIQQFSEGLIWLHFKHQIGSESFFINSQHIFLTFIFLIWPIWIPFSFFLIENIPWRRSLLFINLFIGIILSLFYFFFAQREEISVQIVNQSIQYLGKIPNYSLLTFLYPVVVLSPIFFTSLKNAWIFGLLGAFAYVLSDYFYQSSFISVWCFFSALVSLSIYKIIKQNQPSLKKNSS